MGCEPKDESRILAALYGRQSKGLNRSIQDQLEDGRLVSSENNWQIFREYKDTISASPFARKERGDWPELLADLQTRRFDVLVLWEASRGDRTAETWLGMLRVAAERGVLIHVVGDERTYDPRQDSDWKTLADAGIDSELESRKKSKSIRRGVAKSAKKGLPHGRLPYGFKRVFDPETKELLEQVPVPDRAETVREMFRWAAASHPLKHIHIGLNELGVPSPTGGTWSAKTVRQILKNPAYIGIRRHKEELNDAVWEPIIDETTFWKVQRILKDPFRQRFRPGKPKYLMSCILDCGQCDGLVQGKIEGKVKLAYVCQPYGCTRIVGEPVHGLVRDVILRVVTKRSFYRRLTNGTDAAAVDARAEVERLRAELQQFYRLAGEGRLSADALASVEQTKLPLLEAARERAEIVTVPPALLDLVEPGADALARWNGMPLAGQRDVVRTLFHKVILERRDLLPKQLFSVDRVRFEWRGEFAGFA